MTKKVTRVDKTVDLHKQAVDALQAKNEEYEALNEELRSTIEQLQAATEELQAQNEELQQQAVALRESEEKYRLLFNSGGDAIFIHDEEARILAVNQQACEQFGYTHSELMSMTVNQMDSPAAGKHVPERIDRVIEQGSLLFEIVHQRKDGSLIPHEVNTRRIIWDGQPAMMSICRDITARKQMEEALLNSEAQKNAILNGITTNIALVDKELKILWANKAAVNSVNKQGGHIVGHPCYSFWGDKISPCPNCPTLKAFKTGKSEHIIVETPDGRIWDERGEPILDAAGNVTAVVEIAQDITARKKAEEALRESEERFRILSEAAFEAIAIHEEGVLINANDQYYKMFGYEPSEAIGKQMMSITIAPEAIELVTKKVATDSLEPYESIGVRKDGTRFPIEVRGRKMDYKGRNVRFGAIVDITARKRAEEALMVAEETYRNIFLNSQIGLFRTDLQTGLILDANDTVARFIGYPDRASLMAKPFSMVERYVDSHTRAEMLSLVQAHGEIHNYEARFRRNDGSIIWIRFSAKIVHEKGWMEGVSEDITNRKQAEEALRESEQRFNLAIEGTGAGLWDWDMVKDQVVYSAQWKRMLGYEVHEVEDTFSGWKNLWHPEDCANIEKALDDHLAGKTAHYEIIHRLRHKDGGWRWILTRGDIVKDAQGKPCRWVGTNLDITAQKQAEEEKLYLEERLTRSEKMESLGLLAGGVAHDLNNVLGIVVGYAELVLDAIEEKSPLRKDLKTIFDGGQKAAAIVDDLLTLARRGVVGKQVLNLNKLITDFKKSPQWSKLLTYHPHVQISTELDPDLLNIAASSVHLEKTLYNLVSNAAEAMTSGGNINIKTSNQYIDKPISGYDNIHEGDYVVLSVSDEGDGISEIDLKRIFEPFYTKKIMGRSGTGLGLSVVWGTVKDHQGYIDVHSEEGKGTTFILYFLITREDIEEELLGVSMAEYLGNEESILVVDDVKDQRELATRLLKALNYKVSSVASGEEAIKYLKDHQPDLIVLDMIMDPGIDGLDTYKSILEINPKQRAIIVSGFSESDRVKEAKALGAGAYIKKPYIKEKLGLAVKKELARK